MATSQTKAPESDTTVEAPKADAAAETADKVQMPQLTATETKLVKTAELLKTESEAISANVRTARENLEKLNALVAPTTVLVTNLGVMDDAGNRDNPAIAATQEALDKADVPVNVAEYLELAHMIANTLKAPDLSKLDDSDTQGEATKLRDVLKASEYLDAGEDIINLAKMALATYEASMSSLREWNNRGNKGNKGNTPGPTSMPFNRDNVDLAQKMRSTDKIRETTGWDVEYVCGDHRVTHGDALGSTKHYIRATYREANNLPDSAASAGSPEWADLGPAIAKALTSDSPVEWGNGYIHRVPPTS